MTMATEFYVDEEKVPVPQKQRSFSQRTPPTSRRGRPRSGLCQALRDLEVGGSVWIPNKKATDVSGFTYNAQKLEPHLRFLARNTEKNGVIGTRIWRLPDRKESE